MARRIGQLRRHDANRADAAGNQAIGSCAVQADGIAKRGLRIEPHVHTRPVAATEHVVGAEDHALDLAAERVGDASRAREDVERILRAIPGMGSVARIVRHEHERWDGGGYPDGLAGESIPLGSRIIIAADTYHAITSDRPYRPARSHAEAIAELSHCAGTQFDPAVSSALIGHLYGRRQAGALAS